MEVTSPTDDKASHFSESWREWLKIGLPIIILGGLAFAIAWHFVQPAPPKHVVLATGSHEGMYYSFGKKYAEYFAANGIDMEVKETAGSVENYKLLTRPDSGVDVAIVQGGIAPPAEERQGLQTIAGIYYEPIMVFYRGDKTLTQISQLSGKNIAVGKEGSGVRPMALKLLDEAGVVAGPDTVFAPLGGDDAANALADGKVDAAFYVISPMAPVITRLLGTPGVRLMSFEHAQAYGRRHPFLSAVTLYRGCIDIRRDLPSQDVQLIASPATLVMRGHTHEAIIQLLVRAAEQEHSQGTLLSEAGTFPTSKRAELPVNKDAQYFLTTKPGFLHRTFPFWLASLIDRVLILVLPLLVVVLPLIRMMPPLYAWRIRSRIYRWYKQVRRIDESLNENSPKPAIETGRDQLAVLEKEVLSVRVPLSYTEELYNLRLHIGYVRARLEGWLGKPVGVVA